MQGSIGEANFKSGFQLLRKLGFIPEKGDRAEVYEFMQEMGRDPHDPSCIGELDADLRKQQTFLRLFLRVCFKSGGAGLSLTS